MPATIDRAMAPIPQRMLPQGARPPEPSVKGTDIKAEWVKCWKSPAYFIDSYCQIYDADPAVAEWFPFKLWPAQVATLKVIHENPLTLILKARQLGLTWLVLAYILWLMIFKPVATISVFSRRQEEADYLLGVERLKGMFYRLPVYMQFQVLIDNNRIWQLSNGSIARAFPTSAGDSYTTTLAFADEFDLVEDQGKLMGMVQPTISGGGKMILLSRADKSRPESRFKKTYRAAKKPNGDSPWKAVFLPWYVRPSRDQAWYDAQVQDSMDSTGAIDDVYEQFPAKDIEALAPRSLDKAIPIAFLRQCYEEGVPLLYAPGMPEFGNLTVYKPPIFGEEYVIGGDPAEGKENSDNSSAHVLHRNTGEEVAHYTGRITEGVFAARLLTLSTWYNRANMMIERNNHGHSIILWLKEHQVTGRLLKGDDGDYGWNSNLLGKTGMYDRATETFRVKGARIHSMDTYLQLASIESATLRAPKQQLDDEADSYVLALVGRAKKPSTVNKSTNIYEPDNNEED